jgi:uncharacterized protein YbjT (DUF2867 family)
MSDPATKAAPDPAAPPVVVAGATGQSGRMIVGALLDAGYRVRALVRDGAKAAALPAGVECVTADVLRPETLGPALQGAGVVVSAIGGRAPFGRNGFRAVDWEGNRALVDAAKAAGVSRFILITAGSAGRRGLPYTLPLAPYPWKARAEAWLRASGLAWTVLGPGGLDDKPPGQLGIRAVPRSDYRVGWISRGDLAAVTVACISEPATIGRTITLVNSPDEAPGAWRDCLTRLPAD